MEVSGDGHEDSTPKGSCGITHLTRHMGSGEPQKRELTSPPSCLRLALHIISQEEVVPSSKPTHSCISLLWTLHSGHRKLPMFPTYTTFTLLAPPNHLNEKSFKVS